MPMIRRSVECLGPHGFHRMSYYEWPGPAGAPTVVCVHGLTRNGRDFDVLAQVLQRRFRVVCPDVVGRGTSAWLTHPEDYTYPQYAADMTALIARLDVDDVYWLGTSMGGLIGMMLASQPGTPIRRLIINDVGPVITKDGLQRIASYVGADPSLRDIDEVEAVLRRLMATFGELTDQQWRALAEHSARRKPDGTLGLAYDPGIAKSMPPANEDILLWPIWDQITCPTLLLRGAESDLLREADAQSMTVRGPKAKLVVFEKVGHAPALMAPDQIAVVENFLVG